MRNVVAAEPCQSVMLERALAEQKLSPFVADAILGDKVDDREDFFTPSTVLRGIGAVMMAVRTRKEPPVLGTIDTPGDLTEEERLFAGIANTLVTPDQNDRALPFVQTREHSDPGSCNWAEPRFAGLLLARAQRFKKNWLGPVLVFDDMDGRPVLLQKQFGSDNALGLAELKVDNATYPPGTLYSAHSAPGKVLHAKYQAGDRSCGKMKVRRYSTAEIDSIAPTRLSLYALSPDARQKYISVPQEGEDSQLACMFTEQARTATLDDFAEAFQRQG